ncbi:MAG: hypothetical protein FJY95_17590 [Candidatus Handelsmanbacteria bacterium]|nr:hypothetical protein [Candidatus Handelsmanbacteria bacterium]
MPQKNSGADQTNLDHIRPLARLKGATLLLVHVADGWVARHYGSLNLHESEEIGKDRRYLARWEEELKAKGFVVEHFLAM